LALGGGLQTLRARQGLDPLWTAEMCAFRLQDGDVAARVLDGARLIAQTILEMPRVLVDAVEQEGACERECEGANDGHAHSDLQREYVPAAAGA
jgi:hypothetical protein